jgi:hypothetical protein
MHRWHDSCFQFFLLCLTPSTKVWRQCCQYSPQIVFYDYELREFSRQNLIFSIVPMVVDMDAAIAETKHG